jgi:undecaprenyl-diphosphatase
MSFFEAVILGLVQGLTEFLPISSTAHLRIVPALLGWNDPGAAYSAVIQLGTVGAVLVYFARDLLGLGRAFVRSLKLLIRGARRRTSGAAESSRDGVVRMSDELEHSPFGTVEARLAWFVGIGTIPIGLCGLAFKKAIETSLRSLYVMSGSLIMLALVLWVVERVAAHRRTLEQMTLRDALIIGLWQAAALVPGSSRSGTTITGALSLGFTRADAARYSFLLSIPATTLAGVFELKHLLQASDGPGVERLVVGTAVSFFSGLVAIWGLLRFLRNRSTLIFVAYRLVLGAGLLALLASGRLVP